MCATYMYSIIVTIKELETSHFVLYNLIESLKIQPFKLTSNIAGRQKDEKLSIMYD